MKKGFTLIELLAVIVILAILALIVTPVISGVISDAKKAAAARSMEGYVKAVEYAQAKYQYAHTGSVTNDINDLSIEGSNMASVTNVDITFASSGMVVSATANVDDFNCTYEQNTATVCE